MEPIDERVQLDSRRMAVVARSKKEVYDKLVMKGEYYFPPIAQTNADFISDIMEGRKKVS